MSKLKKYRIYFSSKEWVTIKGDDYNLVDGEFSVIKNGEVIGCFPAEKWIYWIKL